MHHRIPFKNRYISYRVIGKGKPLVLIHGSVHENPWNDFEYLLAQKYKTYIPILPGFGSSPCIPRAKHDTNLFQEALSTFLNYLELNNTPIVALSLGTVVTAKATAKGDTDGSLIFVGAPGAIQDKFTRLSNQVPYFIKRLLVSCDIGKRIFIVPALNNNLKKSQTPSGIKNKKEFVRRIRTTCPCALVDTNYTKEIEKDFPQALKSIDRKIHYIYGEFDKQKETNPLIKDFITIPGVGHNIFESNQEKILSVIKDILNS
jgi:pimeloyl-ACP methyl ester carboxylesterase